MHRKLQLQSRQHSPKETQPAGQIRNNDANAVDIDPAFQIARALALRAVLDDVANGIRNERDEQEMGHGEGQPGAIPAGGGASERAVDEQVGDGGGQGGAVEGGDDPDALLEESAEIARQQGVAVGFVVGVGGGVGVGVQEARQEPVLVPGVHQRGCRGDEGGDAQQLDWIEEQAGCHGGGLDYELYGCMDGMRMRMRVWRVRVARGGQEIFVARMRRNAPNRQH